MTTPITSIIFTHQARLRCLIHGIMYGKNKIVGGDSDVGLRNALYERPQELLDLDKEAIWNDSLPEEPINLSSKEEVYRFKNASMLKITINSQTISVNLMINGVVDEMKKDYVYYVKPGTEEEDVYAREGRYKVVPFTPIEKPNTEYDVGDNTYIFYLVRHGQATHNVYKTKDKFFAQITRKKDTHLTDAGTNQALQSGEEARVLISSGNVAMMLPPSYLFASDLMRTRETLVSFLNGMGIPYTTDIIVLPCSHELDYKKDGNCDAKAGLLSSAENITSCAINIDSCKKIDKYNVDWSAYDNFYKNGTGVGMRSGICTDKSCNAYKCKNTDMLKEAISIINSKQQTGGLKRKKRRTRKRRKNLRNTKKRRYRKKTNKKKSYHKR